MMILEPISIATGGYVGIGPPVGQFCPTPLAIASDGYIRFEVGDRRDGDGGTGPSAFIREPALPREPKGADKQKLAALAIVAIETIYDD